jgi:FAD binding domain-containing protein/berberine-like enzyme
MSISRRTFLGAVAAGAATGLAGCTGARHGTPTATATAPTTTSSSPPVPPDWAALRARLPGGLVLPGEDGYDAARRSYNPLFDGRQPAAVARVTRPEDVQACVEVARAARMPIAARSGGHSYAGYSTPDGGLVVDLAPLSGVEVRADGTAVIGAGARLMSVYSALAGAGRCLPAGSCPTVGIGGLTLGGGIGVLTRKYGLTCDKLVSARIVTADGTVRNASADAEPDLFWALRGGGGGNFGIVTSFTFATDPAPDLTVFSLRFGGGVADVLGAWQQWISAAPPELWSNLVISGGAPPTCRVGGCYVGSESGLRPLLNQLLAGTPRPTSQLVSGKGFLDAMRYFGGCSQRSIEQCRPESEGGQLGRESFVASSRILPGPVDPTAFVSIMDGRSGMDLLLDSLGGAVSTVDAKATAFPHRGALASAQIYAGADIGTQATSTTSVAEVRDGLGAQLGTTGYVNYVDPGLPDWGTAYYGGNLPKLREVAARYDPDAVFTFPQAVPR